MSETRREKLEFIIRTCEELIARAERRFEAAKFIQEHSVEPFIQDFIQGVEPFIQDVEPFIQGIEPFIQGVTVKDFNTLRAENQRLREALEKIAYASTPSIRSNAEIARAALEAEVKP